MRGIIEREYNDKILDFPATNNRAFSSLSQRFGVFLANTVFQIICSCDVAKKYCGIGMFKVPRVGYTQLRRYPNAFVANRHREYLWNISECTYTPPRHLDGPDAVSAIDRQSRQADLKGHQLVQRIVRGPRRLHRAAPCGRLSFRKIYSQIGRSQLPPRIFRLQPRSIAPPHTPFPTVTSPSFHPGARRLHRLRFSPSSVLPPPPVFTYSSSSSASPRLSFSLPPRPLCKLTSGSIVSTCRCFHSPPLGYLAALLPSLLNHSVSCPYRRMRASPRFSLCPSILSSFSHPTLPPSWSDPDARVPPSSEGFLASAADHRAFFILATPAASNSQRCSSDSGFQSSLDPLLRTYSARAIRT